MAPAKLLHLQKRWASKHAEKGGGEFESMVDALERVVEQYMQAHPG